MNKPLISIIMPVFNADKSLKLAIDSVKAQTYSNWELLCVNDGSTDQSETFLHEYSTQDSRIKYWTQKNSGPTLARMLAYTHMKGEFVYLLDSDDTISNDLLKNTLDAIILTNSDAAIPELMVQARDGNFFPLHAKNHLNAGDILTGVNAFKKTFPWKISTFCLWKREIVQKAISELNIPGNNYNTDEFLSRLKLLQCSTIAISRGIHFYNYNFGSITKKFSKKTLLALETNASMIKYAQNKKMSEDILNLIFNFQLRTITNLLRNLALHKSSLSDSEYKEAHSFIKDYYKQTPRLLFPIVDLPDLIIKIFNLFRFTGLNILVWLMTLILK